MILLSFFQGFRRVYIGCLWNYVSTYRFNWLILYIVVYTLCVCILIYITIYTIYTHVTYHDCFFPKSGSFYHYTDPKRVFKPRCWPQGSVEVWKINIQMPMRCVANWHYKWLSWKMCKCPLRSTWKLILSCSVWVRSWFCFSWGGDGIWGYKQACIKQLGIQWISQHLLSSQHDHLSIYSGLGKDFHAKVATMKMAWHFKTQSVESIDICLWHLPCLLGLAGFMHQQSIGRRRIPAWILQVSRVLFPIRILEFSIQPVVVLFHQTFATFSYDLETHFSKKKIQDICINTPRWRLLGNSSRVCSNGVLLTSFGILQLGFQAVEPLKHSECILQVCSLLSNKDAKKCLLPTSIW